LFFGVREVQPLTGLGEAIKINVLDGQPAGPAIRAVLAAAALGLANAPPVGRRVTTAGKTVALDKGFQPVFKPRAWGSPRQAANPMTSHGYRFRTT